MAAREIPQDEAELVVEDPDRVEASRGLTRKYYREVLGRTLAVVLAHDVDPPYVVTVMIVHEE